MNPRTCRAPGTLYPMRGAVLVVVVGLLGCSQSGPSGVDETPPVSPTQPNVDPVADPVVDPADDPPPEPTASTITVHMTAATLADDCGGGPNVRPKKRAAKRSQAKGARSRMAKRRCEQSSIQLSIVSPPDADPADMTVKSVDLSLESGTPVGKLQARAPSVWSEAGGYTEWNQKVEPGQELSVTYALTPPDWSTVEDRLSQTYTVKAVVSIAGADQTVEHDVVVTAPTSLPPNVRT